MVKLSGKRGGDSMIKVLIADDESRVCSLIKNLVNWQDTGMEVVGIAHNGLEALDLISKLSIDLVVTDVRMPGCDGLDLISRAKQISPNLEFIIISGYRQFEYAQSAIKYGVSDYLLKPIKKDELTATLQKMQQKNMMKSQQISKEEILKMRIESDTARLHDGFFDDCFFDDTNTQFDLDKLNAKYRLSLANGIFTAFIVKIDCKSGIFDGDEIKVLSEKAIDIMDSLRNKCCECQFYLKGSRIYGLANYTPESSAAVDKAFKFVMDRLLAGRAAFANTEFTVCIGSAHDDISALRCSVRDAEATVGYRLTTMGGRVICFDKTMCGLGYDDRIISDLNRAMTAAAEVLDIAKLERAIDNFSYTLGSDKSIVGGEIFDAVCRGYNRFLVMLENMQMVSGNELTTEKFVRIADLCPDAQSLMRCFKQSACRLIENLSESRETQESKPIRVAKDYILNNYMNPISLEQVSDLVGFSTSYFSTFFKKKCGVNFLEYLSGIRISKAKELLRDTNLSVADICEQVGYTDIKHFSATFKKIIGIKPTEFRRLYS